MKKNNIPDDDGEEQKNSFDAMLNKMLGGEANPNQEETLSDFLKKKKLNGKLPPKVKTTSVMPSMDEINEMVKEGFKILEEEELKKNSGLKPGVQVNVLPVPPVQDVKELNEKNPYAKARAQILKKMTPDKREEVLEMERTNNKDNRFYTDFVKLIAALAEKFIK